MISIWGMLLNSGPVMAKKPEPEYVTEKPCPRCDTVKPREQFYRNAANKDGLSGYCKVCQAEMDRAKPSRSNAARRARYNAERRERYGQREMGAQRSQ
jgi:hypothetical protein